jgi:hypothetical protein
MNSGRDLIGVQNLIKKHQAVLAEINNHENRIAAVCQSSQQMLDDGHFASEEIKQRIGTLNDHWIQLKEKALQVSTVTVLWYFTPYILCEHVLDLVETVCLISHMYSGYSDMTCCGNESACHVLGSHFQYCYFYHKFINIGGQNFILL